MKAIRHASAALAALAICAPLLTARTYIVERGDTWELIARKWGVHTDALKAANPFFSEIYVGVELDLPDNSSDTPLSNHQIARYAFDDKDIERAERALAEGKYSVAESLLRSSMHRRGHTTAQLYCLYASACEGTSDYVAALENYSNAATLFNNGDRTMTHEQISALNSRMERLVPLATQQKQREAEAQRKRDEIASAQQRREQEKKRRRSEFWGNLGMGLLQGLAQSFGGYSQGWSAPSVPAPNFYTPDFTATFTPVTMPVVVNWDNFSNVTWDQNINYQNFTPSFGWDTVPLTLDGGGFDNGGVDYSGGLSDGDPTMGGGGNSYEYTDCTLCNGTGWMVNNSVTTFGQTGSKYCDICRKTVDLSHGHQRCPSCQNGKQKKRVR